MRRFSIVMIAILFALSLGVATDAYAQPANRYIVTFKDDVADPGAVAGEHARSHGAAVDFVYSHALKGYAATLSDRGRSAVAAESCSNSRRERASRSRGCGSRNCGSDAPPSAVSDRPRAGARS